MWKIEMHLNDVEIAERFENTEEEALAIVESIGAGGQFIRIVCFEKTLGKYEWLCNTFNFCGNPITLKIEIKEVV